MSQMSPRARLIRDAVIYTPLFLICVFFLVLMFSGAADRAIIGIILLAIVTFLFGYQSIQALRDLRSTPQDLQGPITRRWAKRDAFVAKSHYITVEKSIFRIPVESYLELGVGDTVRVAAYPHSGTVIMVERLEQKKLEEETQPRGEPRPATGRLRMLRTARATPSTRRPTEGRAGTPESGRSNSGGEEQQES